MILGLFMILLGVPIHARSYEPARSGCCLTESVCAMYFYFMAHAKLCRFCSKFVFLFYKRGDDNLINTNNSCFLLSILLFFTQFIAESSRFNLNEIFTLIIIIIELCNSYEKLIKIFIFYGQW